MRSRSAEDGERDGEDVEREGVMGVFHPHPTRRFGRRRKPPSGVRGGALTVSEFDSY